MKISKITPKIGKGVENYDFTVKILDGDGEYEISLSASVLLDYRMFQTAVLAKTGRLIFGEGVYKNWNEEISKHLAEFWMGEEKRKNHPANRTIEVNQAPLPEEPAHQLFDGLPRLSNLLRDAIPPPREEEMHEHLDQAVS